MHKIKMRVLIIIILSLTIQVSTSAQKNVFGIYKNNVAGMGFFGEKLALNNDSTFNYYNGGDLMHQYGKGTFTINNRQLIIYFTKTNYGNIDSLISVGKITSLALDSIGNHLLEQKEPNIKLFDSLMKLEVVDQFDINADSLVFIINKQKLFATDEKGKIIRRVQAISKRKKYFLWGEPYMKRRRYHLIKQ